MKPGTICCYCEDFNPRDPKNKGASHGICEACRVKFEEGKR